MTKQQKNGCLTFPRRVCYLAPVRRYGRLSWSEFQFKTRICALNVMTTTTMTLFPCWGLFNSVFQAPSYWSESLGYALILFSHHHLACSPICNGFLSVSSGLRSQLFSVDGTASGGSDTPSLHSQFLIQI